jgi:methyltransferase-like protein/protein-L-isoaspartate O-methyltransferase
MSDSATSYDEVIYPGNPLPQTHPDRLATVASLFGIRPAPATKCRLLELGCGIGGNLTAMAYQFPESEFVGIDLSARSIEIGNANLASLGIRNATLRQFDIMQIGREFGTFDYIVAHGVYSWVPPFVRDKMLAVFRDNLAPNGVAYVSYNAYPGSHFRAVARDMMMYHVRATPDPQEKIAQSRTLLKVLSELVPEEDSYGRVLREQYERVMKMAGEVIYHDDLEKATTPFLLHQVVDAAARQGLQYLAEANFAQTHLGTMPDYIGRLLKQLPVGAVVEREQYLDFFANRSFRQTLLCHDDVPLRTDVPPSVIRDYCLAGNIEPEDGAIDPLSVGEARFKTPRTLAITTTHPLSKAALLQLGAAWPRALGFPELLEAAYARLGDAAEDVRAEAAKHESELVAVLFRAFATEQIEATLYPPRLTTAIGDKPEASLLARTLSEAGPVIVNMRWARVMMQDEFARRFLRLVDGTRDIDALAEALQHELGAMQAETNMAADQVPQVTRDGVERNLQHLARLGLLVA